MNFRKLLLIWIIAWLSCNAYAINVEGSFKVTKSCPAYKSFKRGHNPGDIYASPGRTYEVVEENKENGPWVMILIPEISHSRRWVAKECGIAQITSRTPQRSRAAGTGSHSNQCNTANTYDSNVLALSWQAGFCEHYRYSGVKQECDHLNTGQISITNITIHGLWPNKTDCGRGYGNCSSQALDLEDDTISQLSPWMPNFYWSEDFGRHEWRKHGTCQALTDDEYFLLTQRLAKKFDDSELGQYIRNNIGGDIEVVAMENHLKSTLGEDVTKKIELRCTGSGKRYLNEFWINLPKQINANGTLNDLVAGAKDKHRFIGNCDDTVHIEAPGL